MSGANLSRNSNKIHLQTIIEMGFVSTHNQIERLKYSESTFVTGGMTLMQILYFVNVGLKVISYSITNMFIELDD